MSRPVRRLVSILALSACLVAAGCGGDQESSSPLGSALGYLPAESPFAVAIDTDLEGDQYRALDSILGRFPLPAESIEDLLRQQFGGSRGGVSFENDVKPLLGNPFVVGAEDVATFVQGSSSDEFVAALQVKDEEALNDLIERSKPEPKGELAGATKFEDGGTLFAVEEDMVVFAGSEELLDQALERADGADHLDEETFDEAFEGLPESGLARVYADVEALVASDPDARDASKVEWIGALRTLGLTASAAEDRLEIRFNLRTDSEGLSDEDLPMAAGEESPPVIERDREIGFGIRDPAQIVRFAESAGQAIDPSGYGDYAQAKKTLEARLDVDIDKDLIGQLSGDVSASVALDGKFGLRAELKDAAAFATTLDKVAEALPSLAEGAGLGPVSLERPRGDDKFYALAQADGDSLVFGVVNRVFVLANDPGRAGELATAEPTGVSGAEGAVAMSSDAQQLVNALIRRFGPQLGLGGFESFGAQLFTDPLEDLTGSMAVSSDGLRGRVTLGFE
jgi:Protein of unknown function (DUF3352)